MTASCCLAQIDALEARLTRDHANWLGFCHNDLQCGNVMLDAGSLQRLTAARGGLAGALDSGMFPVVRSCCQGADPIWNEDGLTARQCVLSLRVDCTATAP